jgi:hypothetical protein
MFWKDNQENAGPWNPPDGSQRVRRFAEASKFQHNWESEMMIADKFSVGAVFLFVAGMLGRAKAQESAAASGR